MQDIKKQANSNGALKGSFKFLQWTLTHTAVTYQARILTYIKVIMNCPLLVRESTTKIQVIIIRQNLKHD